MPRPKVNTHTLDLAEKRMLLELFGTPKHAYETLRLAERGVTYVEFQRLWAGMGAPHKAVKTVEQHAQRWRYDFLATMRSPSYKLDLERWDDETRRATA